MWTIDELEIEVIKGENKITIVQGSLNLWIKNRNYGRKEKKWEWLGWGIRLGGNQYSWEQLWLPEINQTKSLDV